VRVIDGGGSVDQTIMEWIHHHRTPWANHLARTVMSVGTTWWLLLSIAVVALAVALWRKAYRTALAGVAALVVAELVSGSLKRVFDRPRPHGHLVLIGVSGDSFPSTHAAVTSAVAVALLLTVAWPSARAAVTAWALALVVLAFVGACLVYLGTHWPSDVLAGWLLGAAIGSVAGLLARRRRYG
jgi:membrane-associated phospholipid phosphatase